ncbi:MAG: DUF3419 family protein [Planctomycetes bacterium]|nr:DUF3419 family protein [Planctomycetota bacterium]
MAKGFFSSLNYSSCNEDWRTERRALRIGPADRVLAVTGSGDRPLNLLLDDPAQVLAIDLNPAQNELLRLKAAAMAARPYDDYVVFLGLRGGAGVLYAGRWERYYRRMARIGRLLRGKSIRRLFECADIEEQRDFVRRVWDRRWWRLVFRVMCAPIISRVFLGDPAFYAHVDPELSVGRYVYESMLAGLDRHLARENFMLSLVFHGRLSEHDLPPYLAPESVPAIRARLGRLEIHTGDLLAFLESVPPGRFTRFSLSDVPSYLDQAGFERLLEGLVRAAAPGARFCIRQFLTRHRLPERFDKVLRREPALEEELRAEDRAFAYRFVVGSVG